MPNGMSEEAQSRGHAVWEGAPCKGALYPIFELRYGRFKSPRESPQLPNKPKRLGRQYALNLFSVF